MKTLSPIIIVSLVLLTSACGKEGSNQLELRYDEVAHVEGCNVHLFHITIRDDGYQPFFSMNYNCGGLPESDLLETKWTKNYLPPPAFTMSVGDCQLFNETFYCVEAIEPEKILFRATYKWGSPDHSQLHTLKRSDSR